MSLASSHHINIGEIHKKGTRTLHLLKEYILKNPKENGVDYNDSIASDESCDSSCDFAPF